MQRIESLPGVRSVTMTEEPPLSRSGSGDTFVLPGRESGESDGISKMRVRGNFFTAMEIPLLLGRGFTDSDNSAGRKVAIVSESVVRDYFPNLNPLGQLFRLGARPQQIEIVGVVKDTNHLDLRLERSSFRLPSRLQMR